MIDTPAAILAKLAAAALFAVVPTLASRWAFNRVCEFKPPWLRAYLAFFVAGIALVIWNELVSFGRDQVLDGSNPALFFTVAAVRLLGSLALIFISVAYVVRDRAGKPIGLGPATIVSLLALIWTAPVGLIAILALAVFFLRKGAA